MHGCNGKMGQMISQLAQQDENVKIVAGIDARATVQNDYPVFADISGCDVEADVVIDFSNASAVDGLLAHCIEKQLPLVLCTTGLSQDQIQAVEETSKKVAVLKSANMSVGINLLMKILKEASAKLLTAGYDCEIVEMHHNQKLDAPSGTALALADAVNDPFNGEYEYVYDRSGRREKRREKEIGISAVRGGSIVGDHQVIFAGTDEVITFGHTAYSRGVFAKGAVEAAKFMAGRPAGMYSMADVLA